MVAGHRHSFSVGVSWWLVSDQYRKISIPHFLEVNRKHLCGCDDIRNVRVSARGLSLYASQTVWSCSVALQLMSAFKFYRSLRHPHLCLPFHTLQTAQGRLISLLPLFPWLIILCVHHDYVHFSRSSSTFDVGRHAEHRILSCVQPGIAQAGVNDRFKIVRE